MSQPNP